MKTAWGRRHQRRFALVDGADVLASATQYDLVAILDQWPVRVCGIGSIVSEPPHRDGGHARELVERLLGEAARDGAAMALAFSAISHEHQLAGFEALSTVDAELRVAESSRRGAPMTLIRGGEERDLAAIVAMGQVRASPFRFYLDRDVDFVQCRHDKATACRTRPGERAPTPFLYRRRRHHGRRLCRRQRRRQYMDDRRVRRPRSVWRALAPFCKRSSRVNPSSGVPRSAAGCLPASCLRKSRSCLRSLRRTS
jgi:hypothetical protein